MVGGPGDETGAVLGDAQRFDSAGVAGYDLELRARNQIPQGKSEVERARDGPAAVRRDDQRADRGFVAHHRVDLLSAPKVPDPDG